MADGVQVDNGGLTDYDVHTDERSIGGATKHVQRTVDLANSAFATGQVTPTTTAATLLAARETRKSVVFINRGSQDVFVGPATVTAANGFPIAPGAALTMTTAALIQCIIAAGTATSYVAYVETYDS